MNIKAIETRYNGYRFRSRTEARWAVFFDAFGIRYEYEQQGYELKMRSGTKYYLPDFWLPDLQLFVEVKGQKPTDEESDLCVALHEQGRYPALMVWGLPKDFPLQHSLVITDTTDSGGGTGYFDECFWGYCPYCHKNCLGIRCGDRDFWTSDFEPQLACQCGSHYPHVGIPAGEFETAAEIATGARFEHGESPRVGVTQ